MDDADMFATQVSQTMTQHDLDSSSPVSKAGDITQEIVDPDAIDTTNPSPTGHQNPENISQEIESDGFFETQQVATPGQVHNFGHNLGNNLGQSPMRTQLVATPRANLFSYDATQQVAPLNETQRLLLGFQPSGDSDDVQVFGTPFARPGPRENALDADAIPSDTEDREDGDHDGDHDEDHEDDHADNYEEDLGIIEETPFKTPVRRARRTVSQEFETPAPRNIGRPHPLRNAVSTISSEFKSPPPVAFSGQFPQFTQGVTARTSSIVSATPDQVCLLVPWGTTWYPATAVNPNQYLLLKDDPEAEMDVIFGTAEQGKIKPCRARLLELVAGDKVNYKGNARYTIVDLHSSQEGSDIATVSGFDMARIQRLKRKYNNSKPETLTVYVKDVVLTAPLFAEWQRAHPEDPNPDNSLHRTVSIDTSTGRPPSRPLSRPLSRAEKRFRKDPGIFEGSVFAVTMANHSCSDQVSAAIQKLGGRILSSGITDMLALSSGSMELRWKGDQSGDQSGDKFAAVIASRPIKTPKYLEGLAIGWPCLSYRFILDCAAQNQFLENWTDYVLAAGDSQVMDAAISLDVSDFRERFDAGQTLSQQFLQRRLALGPIASAIYLLDVEKSLPLRLLLMAATARPPVLISKLDQAPSGSIVIDTDRKADLPAISEPGMVLRMCRQLVLPQTLVYGREWLIQCIINQRPV